MRRTLPVALVAALGWAAIGSSGAMSSSAASVPVRGVGAQGRAEYAGPPSFGQLAVTGSRALLYVDQQRGEIDEITSSGPRVVLGAVGGRALPPSPAIFATGGNLWVAANGGIYEVTLSGRVVRQVASGTPPILALDVLSDGAIYYSTERAVFERIPSGRTARVAGGGDLFFAQQQQPRPATADSINPVHIAGIDDHAFDFVDENLLYLVRHGTASLLRMSPVYGNFFNGELARAPDGQLFAICGWELCRVDGSVVTPTFRLPTKVDGFFAAPISFAIAPDGDYYESFTSQSSPGDAGIFEASPTGKLLHVLVSR